MDSEQKWNIASILVSQVLDRVGLPKYGKKIVKAYTEPHRYYHNLDHLADVVYQISENSNQLFAEGWNQNDLDDLVLAACFHDIVYDIDAKPGENERLSAEIAGDILIGNIEAIRVNTICAAILSTQLRNRSSEEFAATLWDYDNAVLYNNTVEGLFQYEKKIFKEYQKFSYPEYKAGRIKFLEEEIQKMYKKGKQQKGRELQNLLAYVQNYRPNIGLYGGSFDPFHVGHNDILIKGKRVFDKVIICRAINPDKKDKILADFPHSISNREIIYWSGLVTNLIKKLSETCNVTYMRGLRSGKDLEYEANLYRYMQDMYPEINTVFFYCDSKYKHVSSSDVNKLLATDPAEAQRYLIK